MNKFIMRPMLQFKNSCTLFKILPFLFLTHLALMWPGYMTPDSESQYASAVLGQYSDHHPFIMSFLWRYLDMLHKGPGLMLFLHLGLLYTSMFFLMKSVQETKLRFLILLLPLFPHVLVYSGFIWKDVGFAFSYLFVLSVLAYLHMQGQKLTFPKLMGVLIVLIYGTLVKFQAQYLAPFVLLWMVYHRGFGRGVMTFAREFALIITLFYAGIFAVNEFGPKVTENHSWQMVKFYDLAAISVGTDTDLFPESAKTKHFSMKVVHNLFNHQSVDALIYSKTPLFKNGQDDEERNIVWNAWAKAVVQHPFLYLRHRAANLAYMLLSMPHFEYIEKGIDYISEKGTLTHKTMYYAARAFGAVFWAHILPILLSFAYVLLGLCAWRTSKAAVPLVFMNGVGLLMPLVLFFFCMAGTPRYTYITVCLFHASHVFAYLSWKSMRRGIPI